MTPTERVMCSLDFRPPDRVPLFDGFWPEWVQMWHQAKPECAGVDPTEYYEVDIRIAVGDESLAPSQAQVLEQTENETIQRDGWGRVIRTVRGGFLYEQIGSAVRTPADLDRLPMDPRNDARRYDALDTQMDPWKTRACVFAKVGGPFIRTCFVRGEADYLMDMVADPVFAAELTMRLAAHLTAVGLEELRRWNLHETGIWIYDDMASVKAPLFSPRTAEAILAPAWDRMIRAFRAAGARKIILHSDGNIGPLLDLFVDLGFDGIHPVEPRAGLSVPRLRERYGDRLALLGGICNSVILPRGDRGEIATHVHEVRSVGKEGGLIIGSHSIGPDISVDTYDWFIHCVRSRD